MLLSFQRGLAIVSGVALMAALSETEARAGQFKTLYAFSGAADGASPESKPIADADGNLYGTAEYGGRGCDYGCGVVFKLTPDGQESVLYSFRNRDGAHPVAGVIRDAEGNLYGTTDSGGAHKRGVVFKLAPDGTETVLHAFGVNKRDGRYPDGGLVRDGSGNLYGTTSAGGTKHICSGGCGTVFKIRPDATEKVLYRFRGGADGETPLGDLIRDKDGNLYGTTYDGGSDACLFGCGTVYKLDRHGKKTTLYNFTGGSDGEGPRAGLVRDAAGNLYGTTGSGGGYRCLGGMCGVVFKVAPDGAETVLHAFAGGDDGSYPLAGLILDSDGAVYGTTSGGGPNDYGVAFKVDAGGVETVLHAFDGDHGSYPAAALLRDRHVLIGTTSGGGPANSGTVFAIRD